MKVSDLKPAEYNPRQITDDKLSMLDKAMRAFGDLSGVIFNRETGNLIGGHQRVKNLAPEWKVEKEPFADDLGTVAQGYIETPFGRWVYREVEWDKNQEAAANVAANQHGGEWLYPELTNIMTELDDGEFDMGLLGFDDGELEELLGHVPDFQPGTEDDQGQLDELQPKMVKCPHCEQLFDSRGHEQN